MSGERLVLCPGCGERIPVPRAARAGDLIDCANCAGVKFRLVEGPEGDALRMVQMVACPVCGGRIPVDDDTPEGTVIEHDGVAFRLVRMFGAFSLARARAAAASPERALTIGRVAKAAGVNVETVRYYERRGLIERPRDRRGAFRVYPPGTPGRIRSIKRAQALGFSLEEVAELLDLRLAEGARCGDVLAQTQRKLDEIEEKLRGLQRVKRRLRQLASACRAELPAFHCPILEDLIEGAGDEESAPGARER